MPLSEWFAFALRDLGGPVRGFVAEEVSQHDPDELSGAVWDGPRFDVPTLGLKRVTAGEILLPADVAFQTSTADVKCFDLAVSKEDPDEAERIWRSCLQIGEMKAHFGLGYTLFELKRYDEAYNHLRFYPTLCPHNAWAWCWYGKAAQAIGEFAEARRAFARAIECEERGGDETEAGKLLRELDSSARGA